MNFIAYRIGSKNKNPHSKVVVASINFILLFALDYNVKLVYHTTTRFVAVVFFLLRIVCMKKK